MSTFTEFYQTIKTNGKQFEHFIKWFLVTDPEWSTQVDKIWLWDEYPGRWGADCGIDLVFQHKNGEIWAVQAKCYDPEYYIKKADIDSFISESGRPIISRLLLIATTDLIGNTAKKTCDDQGKPVVRFMLSDFEKSDIDYPSSFENTGKRKDKPLPTPEQFQAVIDLVDGFKDADRSKLIRACGTGKTLITLWVKEKLSAKTTLVLVPSLNLLSQTLREWTSAANESFDVLCVCSDKSTGKVDDDITEFAFPVTSDKNEINKFLNKDTNKVIFSTYQSSSLVTDGEFDFVVADEAHHCAGNVTSDFAIVLDGDKIKSKKRLFATATPRIYSTSTKNSAEGRGIEIACMDDEAVFGKVSHLLTFGKAIELGILSDYRVVIVGVDNTMIADWIKNRELVATDTGIKTDAESLAAQIGLLKAIKDYDLKRVISFHSNIKRAESFKNEIKDVFNWVDHSGSLVTDTVSGEMPARERQLKLSRLKDLNDDEIGILSNVRCLGEGINLPELDCVAFIDPKYSQIDIAQGVGRAIRKCEGKAIGTIVIPVFINSGDDIESSIESSNFKPVWNILNALRSHDDVLSHELDEIRTNLGRKPGSKVKSFSKITIDLPMSVDVSFSESINTYLVEQCTNSWDYWFGLLESYMDDNKLASTPKYYITKNGDNLGRWVSTQRNMLKNKDGKTDDITQDRINRLDGLQYNGVNVWSWNVFTDQWEEYFNELERYIADNGHSIVPHEFITKNGDILGRWVSRQRAAFKNNGGRTLAQDRINRLNSLQYNGINVWSWDVLTDQWEEGFRELERYISDNGHSMVKNDYVSKNGYNLRYWVGTQRKLKNKDGRTDAITQDRINRLNSLQYNGINVWSWNPKFEQWEAQWEDNFKEIEFYIAANGHALVPQRYITKNGDNLGGWVGDQRNLKNKDCRADDITQDRINRLNSLQYNGVNVWSWGVLTDQWEKGFKELEHYIADNGHARVPRDYIDKNSYKLGRWVSDQRKLKNIDGKTDAITQDRINRLNSLQYNGVNVWSWNPKSEQWEVCFKEIECYIAANGHTMVPQDYIAKNGNNLRYWVSDQRKLKNKDGKTDDATQDRIDRLNALDGWTWFVNKPTVI